MCKTANRHCSNGWVTLKGSILVEFILMAQKRGHSEELGVTTSPDTKRSKVEQRSPLQEESDDWTSSSGSSLSSEEEEDGEEDGNEETDDVASDAKEQFDEITTVPGRPRPRIERPQHSELLSRVSSFLPQLKAANEDLERRIAEGNARDHVLDDVPDDDEQGGRPYIEMVCACVLESLVH